MSSEPLFVQPGAPPRTDGRPVPALASTEQRVAARLIDFVVVTFTLMALQLLLLGWTITGDVTSEVMTAMAFAAVLAILWIWAFLRVFRLVMWGCTVGQRIAGIRVVRLDDLRYPSWKQAFSRWSPTWGGTTTSGNGPWSDLLAYRRDELTRRCLHDMRAGTVVIRAENAEPVHRAALAASIPILMAVLLLVFVLIT